MNDRKLCEDTVLGRYVGYTKLLDLVLNRRLRLSRLDEFDDPLDGELNIWDAVKPVKFEFPEGWRAAVDEVRRRSRVSCWHEFDSSEECDALWRRYADHGFLLTTTIGTIGRFMEQECPQKWRFARAIYGFVPPEIPTDSVLCKQGAFRTEREVRFVIDDPCIEFVTVDPNELIEAIILSPVFADWEAACVTSALSELAPGLREKIWTSAMKGRSLRGILKSAQGVGVDIDGPGRMWASGRGRVSSGGIKRPL